MATLANSTPAPGLSRRSMFAALAVVPMGFAAQASSDMPDAALLAREPVIAEMTAARDALYPAIRTAAHAAFEACGPSPEAHTPECRAWFERLRAEQARNGHDVAKAAYEAADDALDAEMRGLIETRATTLEGLTLKARLIHEHSFDDLHDSILQDLLALAGVGN